MNGQNVVAVYGARVDAERARERLVEFGIPAADIRMSDTEPTAATTGTVAVQKPESFWDWLFGRDVPTYDRGWYETNLREGRTVLSVLVRSGTQRERVEEILDQFEPIDFGEHSDVEIGTSHLPESPAATQNVSIGEGEQVIPVVKEELAVGKRASERRYRIHTYVVETPAEQNVTLRDERVVVERRPASGEQAIGAAEPPREREYEVVERHEEPVVEKRARAVEEVVVRKEATERTETVRDKVRETKVDVENHPDTAAAPLEPTLPVDRKP
ncbi:MAG TPA: YsnF/AvaK domain-containing protein [Stellaceae bacterium]|jgi:stress response protein YsnF